MSIEDLTIREMKDAIDLLAELAESSIKHAMVMVGDADHECDIMDEDDLFSEMPEMDEFEIRVFLAYEEAVLATCKLIRRGLITQGWTELTKELGT